MSEFQILDAKTAEVRIPVAIALAGGAGSGKTWTALMIATELAAGGPVGLLDLNPGAEVDESVLGTAARITARYGKGKREDLVRVRARRGAEERILEVAPATPEECEAWVLR